MTLVFAHVSDTHLDLGARAAERAARVMTYLNSLDLDAILVTGDIADHGLAAEYAEARRLLASRHPVLVLPGNHDVRAGFRALLGEEAADGPVNQVHKVGDAVFVLCDSIIPGRDEGYLTDETLAWLDSVLLAHSESPTFVCFHHPPVLLHNKIVDQLRMTGEDRLAVVIRRHRHVVALLCGHAHTAAASTFAGRPLLVGPGVVNTLMLPWERRGHVDGGEPPALAFHVLDDDHRLVTHYRVLPQAS